MKPVGKEDIWDRDGRVCMWWPHVLSSEYICCRTFSLHTPEQNYWPSVHNPHKRKQRNLVKQKRGKELEKSDETFSWWRRFLNQGDSSWPTRMWCVIKLGSGHGKGVLGLVYFNFTLVWSCLWAVGNRNQAHIKRAFPQMFEEMLYHNNSPTILRSELRAACFNVF